QHPFVLIAHSFGGAIATEYTLRHPEAVSQLVLIGVPIRFNLSPLLRRALLIPDPIFSRVAKIIHVALFASQRTLKRMHDRIMSIWQGSELMRRLCVPTLVVMGQRDRVFRREDYSEVPRCIPNAQQVVIPVSSHLVQLERSDAVNRAIRRFIEPKLQDPKEARQQNIARSSAAAARSAEMPWLQHYDTDVPEQLPQPRQLISEMLSNAAREFPDRPALSFFGQKMRYRELDALSNRFAHALRSLGIGRGDRVALVLPNIPQFVIAFYGTLKAGAVLVLGSSFSHEDEMSHQLQNSGAICLVTLSAYRAQAKRICADTTISRIIYTDVREYLPIRQRILIASLIEGVEPHTQQEQLVSPNGKNGSERKVTAPLIKEYNFQTLLRSQLRFALDSGTSFHDLALVQYTSGTTDTPKGVMLSHGNLMMNVAQIRHWISDAKRGREVVLGVLPLSHAYGVTSCLNTAIAMASSLVLLPTTRIEAILETIKREHPSIFPGIPALYLAVANYPRVRKYGIGAVRICVSGAAPLPVEVQEDFEKLTRGRLVEGYGLTEASPSTHSNPLKGERRVGSIGIPLPSTNARIVDITTNELQPSGEVGELLIRGPQVMQGYWNMPQETAKVLQDGWLHTGDLASMDEDGFFAIVDRKKDLILSETYNVYPRDVEEVLYEHPKVLEAAVVSMASTQHGETSPFIKAVVVLKRGEQATADELLALCRERLDAYKVPKQIEFRRELPKNIVGKVLRRLLIEA
ncbi:MAG: alpha/beta fold hydrolase, partial [Chloroflexota bacterium]|nr:alpha/beta fold hydrolase [Chloroflexota bacterium]